MAPPQGYGATAKRKRSSASHMETKQDLRPEENHSRSGSARSTSWAECRNKKGSAPSRRGDVSLDIPSPETPSSLCWCDLEAQFGCFLSEELDLLSAISVFVVLSAFVNVSLTILQHSIDQSGEPVGHRRNGLRGT